MTARKVKRFKLAGTVVDNASVERLRFQWESLLLEQMERRGYVRIYDLEPTFKLWKEGVGFKWELYIQGAYVGKQEAQNSEGLLGDKLIPRGKSKRQLQPAG